MKTRRLLKMTVGICLIVMLAMVVAVPAFAADKKIKLTFNDHNPPGSTVATAWDDWAAWVKEKSGGRLAINVIHGGALFTGEEVFKAVNTGACDGGHYVFTREDGFLLNYVWPLPFMGWPKQHVEGKYMTLLSEFPEMQAEFEGVTILSTMMMPPTHIHTVSKVIRTPDDIKGVKIFCAQATDAEIMNATGATAVEMGIMDMTPSVQTGLAQGVFNHFPVLFVFGTLELTKSHTVFGDGGVNLTPMFLIMNTAKLNGLPADLQQILRDSGQFWFDKQAEYDAGFIAASIAFCKENNHTFTYLTPEQVTVWYKKVKRPVHNKWIKECEAKGLPGKAVYKRALELVAE